MKGFECVFDFQFTVRYIVPEFLTELLREMELANLRELSASLKVNPDRLVREYWEMMILRELSSQKWSTKLIFKGGTALRLAYQHPRYSDDLDFSISGMIPPSDLFDWGESIARKYHLRISDRWQKYNTLLLEFAVRQEPVALPFRMKLEISLRKPFMKRKDWELRLLTSPTANFDVLFRVATLDRIFTEKIAALKDRKEPRDLFDVWYLAQKLKREIPTDLPRIDMKILRQTLNKYLPTDWRPVIKELAQR